MSSENLCDIGVLGLGVMGQNLALNLSDHGFKVAGFDLDSAKVQDLLQKEEKQTGNGNITGCTSANHLIDILKKPRVIVILVPAGPIVDAVCESLINAGAEEQDLIIDSGNSLWTDTIRRESLYKGKIKFFGSGISGGEVGARFGPSLMPSGDPESWQYLKPFWEALSAKVDPETGLVKEDFEFGKPIKGGTPCTTYIGPNGAGHYVKMVHNGVEYADMQLICEAYEILRNVLGLTPKEISAIFTEWNEGDLNSYLIEITADILQQDDPVTGKPMVDVILDRAGQKGTGKWTAVNSLDIGTPSATIAEAVFARAMSSIKDQRVAASKVLPGPALPEVDEELKSVTIDAVRDALYCSKISAYAQGFQLMEAAQEEYSWDLNFGAIASIWRGGCIIRARFLSKITEAYEAQPDLPNLFLADFFKDEVNKRQANWRKIIGFAASHGISLPAFYSALAYYDGYRSETTPANLLQGQRDYFGAHTYERVDQPRGNFYHLDWSGDRQETLLAHVHTNK